MCHETAGFFGFFLPGGTPFPLGPPMPTGRYPPLLDDPGPHQLELVRHATKAGEWLLLHGKGGRCPPLETSHIFGTACCHRLLKRSPDTPPRKSKQLHDSAAADPQSCYSSGTYSATSSRRQSKIAHSLFRVCVDTGIFAWSRWTVAWLMPCLNRSV